MSDVGERVADAIEYKFKEGISVIIKTTGKGLKDVVSEAVTAAIDKCKFENGTLTEMKPIDFTKKYRGKALSNVKIPDQDILAFKKELVKHGVDFTIHRDNSKLDEFGKPAECEVMFMGSNIDQIKESLTKVFGEFAQTLVSEHKPLESVQLVDAAEKVGKQVERMKEHEVSGRGAR